MKIANVLLAIILLTSLMSAQGQRPEPPKYTIPTIHLSHKISGELKVSHWSWWYFLPYWTNKFNLVKIQLPKDNEPSLAVAWINDETHPVGSDHWTDYDPRGLLFTNREFVFKAIPGDVIWYTVGWRSTN